MYTVRTSSIADSNVIYDYTLGENITVKNGEFVVPYPSYQPNLAYNSQLSVLEVVGDYWSKSGFHLQLEDSTGKFSQYQNSFYNADMYSTIVYSENVGTVCIGGKNGGQNVYIITQNDNWDLISEVNNNLKDILSTGFKYFGFTTHQNSIFLVGGTGGTSASGKVQMIDFDQVSSLTDAQDKNWVMLGFLKSQVEYSTVQFFENQLYVVGRYQNADVQYFNLTSETSGTFKSVIDPGAFSGGLRFPGSFVMDGVFSIFGGYQEYSECIQQSSLVGDIGNDWICGSNETVGFEGLLQGGYGQMMSYVNIF